MPRVADYIADYVFKKGIKDVFVITGGGAMFLNDGVAKHPQLKALFNHHEQASAMAGVGYAKYNGRNSVIYVTTGCGGTNAMTGLLDAWQDNTPCIFISGQVKRKETTHNSGLPLRQFGVQEADIVNIVKTITKYSVQVNNPEEIAYHLDKAFFLANEGRPGPVWLDIPMDVQAATVEENTLKRFSPDEIKAEYKTVPTPDEVKNFVSLLNSSKRPIIIAGNGVRLSNSTGTFLKVLEKYKIPVVTSYLSKDILSFSHPLNIGCIGIKGSRSGNFAMQNADLVIALGTRLCVPMTGYEYNLFAREAKIVAIDIDPKEHLKNTVKIDTFINADVAEFLKTLDSNTGIERTEWNQKCLHWKEKWPVCLDKYAFEKNGINMYYFVDTLSKNLKKDSVVVSDAGSAYYVTSQALKLEQEQRYVTSGAQADMGFTTPAAIGVCIAKSRTEVIGITGDGSLQMNIQELQTIVHNKLPIKLFVLNNDGYLSIRATQNKFFENRFFGTDSESGISFPELKKIAAAYGIKYFKISKSSQLDSIIKKVLKETCPVLIEVICPKNQDVIPTVSSFKKNDGTMVSKPLEDLYPFMDRTEFAKEMIIKPMAE